MNRKSWIAASALGFIPSIVSAQLELVRGAGSTLVVEWDNSSGEYQIELECIGSPSATATIRAIGGSNPIRYVRVRTTAFNQSSGNASISIVENGGTIPHIREIQKVANPNADDGELWLMNVEVNGTIGVPSTPHTGFILADIVSQLTSINGDITADIVAGPRLFGGTSTIVHMRAPSGHILGDISARYGAIDEITAGSTTTLRTIGSTSDTVSIEALYGIKLIQAGSIYADIEANYNASTTDGLRKLVTHSGPMKGQVKAYLLSGPAGTDGMYVAGDLDANVTVRTDVFRPIIVGGDLQAGRTLP